MVQGFIGFNHLSNGTNTLQLPTVTTINTSTEVNNTGINI